MKKNFIVYLIALLLLSAPVWADSSTATSEVTANAHLTYAPSSYYEGQEDKRFHMNVPYGVHLINPSQAMPPPKDWFIVTDPALEKTFNKINWGGAAPQLQLNYKVMQGTGPLPSQDLKGRQG